MPGILSFRRDCLHRIFESTVDEDVVWFVLSALRVVWVMWAFQSYIVGAFSYNDPTD